MRIIYGDKLKMIKWKTRTHKEQQNLDKHLEAKEKEEPQEEDNE